MNLLARYVPIIDTLSHYRKEDFRFDLVAGLTVAVVALPQSMAYAMIAGVDPVYGLYTAIVLSILGSMLGSSNHLATGPTNAIALLIASYMALYIDTPNFFATLFLLTFMVGLVQFLMGALRLGSLVNYVSHSVIVGFTAGAGIIIALGQLNSLLGISLPKGKLATIEKVMLTFQQIDQLNYVALGLGFFTIAVIIICKKVSKNLPGALMGIVISVILVMALDLQRYGIKLAGEIPSAIPPFKMLSFDIAAMQDLLGGAFVIAIIGLVEAVSISKAISARTMQKIDANQEFIGQGAANMGGAFLGCFAGSGSFTRSAIAFQNGGRTRLAGVLTGFIILAILICAAPYAKFIPNASLAGVIMTVAYSMVDKKALAKVFKLSRSDALVMGVTMLTTVFAHELEYAIYAGVTCSIILFLRNASAATVRVLAPDKVGETISEFEMDSRVAHKLAPPLSIIELDGNLYFGSSANLEKRLGEAYNGAKVFILRFNNVSIDVTALGVIENFVRRAMGDGRTVILCGVRPGVLELLRKSGLLHQVGEENVFVQEDNARLATQKAVAAAAQHLNLQSSFGWAAKLAKAKKEITQPVKISWTRRLLHTVIGWAGK